MTASSSTHIELESLGPCDAEGPGLLGAEGSRAVGMCFQTGFLSPAWEEHRGLPCSFASQGEQVSPHQTDLSPWGLTGCMLRELADVISRLLSIIFERSCPVGEVHEDLKTVNATPVFIEGKKEDPGSPPPL